MPVQKDKVLANQQNTQPTFTGWHTKADSGGDLNQFTDTASRLK